MYAKLFLFINLLSENPKLFWYTLQTHVLEARMSEKREKDRS